MPSNAFHVLMTDEERRKEGIQEGYNAAASLAIAFNGLILSEDIQPTSQPILEGLPPEENEGGE